MFDGVGGALREEEGGRGTAGSREEGAKSWTEHRQKILVSLDFCVTRYNCNMIGFFTEQVNSFIDMFGMLITSL